VKLARFYELIIEYGIEADPRGSKRVKAELAKKKHDYEALSAEEREEFDTESLKNPYLDTRLLNGDPDIEVKSLFVGIDIEVAELLLFDNLRRKERIDLVISHHPEGRGLSALYEVMHMQSDILADLGVPVSVAESLMGERIKEVERKLMPANHTRAVDAARILGIPFMCVHTVADNHATGFLQNLMAKEKPEYLGDVLKLLKQIPEYRQAMKERLAPPKIILGDANKKAGKIFVDMTGGTEGSKDIFKNLSQAGIDTLLCMHLSEEHFKKSKEARINVIIAGHIPSDTLGLNLLLDRIEKKEKFKIISCSGFRRIKRKQ